MSRNSRQPKFPIEVNGEFGLKTARLATPAQVTVTVGMWIRPMQKWDPVALRNGLFPYYYFFKLEIVLSTRIIYMLPYTFF
ncbi:hypothetical protein FKM82_003201 [Ascaphus truei]